jgi:hypothetical protein
LKGPRGWCGGGGREERKGGQLLPQRGANKKKKKKYLYKERKKNPTQSYKFDSGKRNGEARSHPLINRASFLICTFIFSSFFCLQFFYANPFLF